MKAYNCKTKDEAVRLLQYWKKKGFKWVSGDSLDGVYGYSPETYYFINLENKEVTYGNLEIVRHFGFDIVNSIPSDLIHPEFELEFKKLFRLNRMPESLTESQIDKMKELKVDTLWMIKSRYKKRSIFQKTSTFK